MDYATPSIAIAYPMTKRRKIFEQDRRETEPSPSKTATRELVESHGEEELIDVQLSNTENKIDAETNLNKFVIQLMLVALFTKGSIHRGLIFDKWICHIPTSPASERLASLKDLILRIDKSRGSLEIENNAIRLFDEGDVYQTVQKKLTIEVSPLDKDLRSGLIPFLKCSCKKEVSSFLSGNTVFSDYKYNELLSEMLERAKYNVLFGFVHYFRDHHHEPSIDGFEKEAAVEKRMVLISSVLKNILCDTTIKITHNLLQVITECLPDHFFDSSPSRNLVGSDDESMRLHGMQGIINKEKGEIEKTTYRFYDELDE